MMVSWTGSEVESIIDSSDYVENHSLATSLVDMLLHISNHGRYCGMFFFFFANEFEFNG